MNNWLVIQIHENNKTVVIVEETNNRAQAIRDTNNIDSLNVIFITSLAIFKANGYKIVK